MGWFKKVFGKAKCKKSSDPTTENHVQTESSNHGNVSASEVESDDRRPKAPEENPNEENANRVVPTSPVRESPPHCYCHAYEPDYQPWSSYGTGGWHTTSYQQGDYHHGGYTMYRGDHSGQQNQGNFFNLPRYYDHGDRSSGRFTGYDNFAGGSGQMNNYWSPPRMLEHDVWNRGQYVKPDHDVWNLEYWHGLFKPPPGGWS